MVGIILNFGNARRADSTFWNIDDALYSQIILAVVNRLQIRQDILDLRA